MYRVQIGDEYQEDVYDFIFNTFYECADFIKICLKNKHIIKVEFIEQET